MKDFVNYFYSRGSLTEKEALLYELIDLLDKESYNLFSEITNLSNNSTYKLESLSNRMEELDDLLAQVDLGNICLKHQVENRNILADSKFYSKLVLLGAISTCIFRFDAILAILVLFYFFNKFDDKHELEKQKRTEKIKTFDNDKLKIINNTLDNCDRLLSGKMDRTSSLQISDRLANKCIESYIDGRKLNIDYLSDDIKEIIKTILTNDLNTNENSIEKLLSSAKENHNKTLKLLKKYE